MKKLSFTLIALLLLSACDKEHSKEYTSVSGKLKNNKDSLLIISGQGGFIKKIKIQADGSFKDTLKVPNTAIYTAQTNREKRTPLFLKNGFDISIAGDAEQFMTSFKLTGKGSENTNFILAQIKESQSLGNPALILELKEKEFRISLENIKKRQDSILKSYEHLDSVMIMIAEEQTAQMINYFNQEYSNSKSMAKGTPAPKFENYLDFNGGKKSLTYFLGTYVYIDVWATWCGPCIQQIPFLKTLEEEYKNKNIEFISISTDESRRSGGSWEAAETKWKTFVENKQLTGTQLWSGQDYAFQQAFQINSIPRFILIDPQGNIVDANAARPSDPKLKELFGSLGI
jgi:thiol-disulfide isomerase/thioredoxin